MEIKLFIKKSAFRYVDRLALLFIKKRFNKILLIVKTDAIGDYILFRNYLQIIRASEKYNSFKIILCGNVIYRDLAVNLDNKCIDYYIWVDNKKMVRNIFYRICLLRKVSLLGASIAFNPTYSRDYFSSDCIINASGALEKIGCRSDTTIQSYYFLADSNKIYTRLIESGSTTIFEFLRNKNIVEHFLGHTINVTRPTLNLSNSKFDISPNISENVYILISPSASSFDKRWSCLNYASLINRLCEVTDYNFVIVGSTSDCHIADQIILEILHAERVVNLTAKTSLTNLISLISSSRLVVSNDTSTLHFAAALNIPVICISKGDHFGRFTEYPSFIGNVTTVYPPDIMLNLEDKEMLKLKYTKRSPLLIDSITVDIVFDYVFKKLYFKN